MGLDQYALVRMSEPLPSEVDFVCEKGDEKFFYWRKHPNLQGWMERLYYEKGGKSEVFNCVNLQLTLEDLSKLEVDTQFDRLPWTTGFFFGTSSDLDDADTLSFIKKARALLKEGASIYYTSWW